MYKSSQKGRSMIEMLGVLAIIGVLSAGGIAGYSTAMESYKVNKTLQLISEGTMNTMTFVRKREKGNTVDFLRTDDICGLGIISGDMCNKGSGNDRKGFWGETVEPRVDMAQESVSVPYDVTTSEGVLDIYSPVSLFQLTWKSAIPVSACAKIMSSPSWASAEIIAVAWDLGDLTETLYYELPLSVDTALSACEKEMSGDSVLFNIQWWFMTGQIVAE